MPYFAGQPGALRVKGRTRRRTNRSLATLPIRPLACSSFILAGSACPFTLVPVRSVTRAFGYLRLGLCAAPSERLEQRLAGIESRRQLRALLANAGPWPGL